MVRRQAEGCGPTSPLYARVCRELVDEPLVAEIAPDMRWDLPLRLLGALHYLALAEGIDPWRDVRAVLANRRESFGLLPAFLSLGDRPLDLIELGPSAGLNLVFDRYRYRYRHGAWGSETAALELSGEERSPVPAALLERGVEVSRRRGIDLAPVDVSTEEGALLLECFVWADQRERIERLRLAIEAIQVDPPELIRGDYVALLPAVLVDGDPEALTVVFQTASTGYLPDERDEQLRRALDGAPRPIAWLSTRRLEERETNEDGYELELAFPGAAPRLVAHMGWHGQWLEWLG